MFDPNSVQVADTATLIVRHPRDDTETTWRIELAGPGHPATLAVQNETARERMLIEREIETSRANGKKWKGRDIDPEADRLASLKRVSRRIVGWSGVGTEAQPFPYSPGLAEMVMTEPRFAWVAGQVLEYFGSEAAFIVTSAKG